MRHGDHDAIGNVVQATDDTLHLKRRNTVTTPANQKFVSGGYMQKAICIKEALVSRLQPFAWIGKGTFRIASVYVAGHDARPTDLNFATLLFGLYMAVSRDNSYR